MGEVRTDGVTDHKLWKVKIVIKGKTSVEEVRASSESEAKEKAKSFFGADKVEWANEKPGVKSWVHPDSADRLDSASTASLVAWTNVSVGMRGPGWMRRRAMLT